MLEKKLEVYAIRNFTMSTIQSGTIIHKHDRNVVNITCTTSG